LQVAHREAYALAIAAAITSKETIEDLVKIANMQMLGLSSRLPSVAQKAESAEETEKS
jgi:Pyruvate/2-oxoacid:ferredoxin oxidoreductase gamma subunit